MSTSLSEAIQGGGFDLSTVEDARWLVGTQSEYEQLIEQAENLIEESENEDDE